MSTVIDSSAVLLFFVANFIYCTAYMVKDILWLRIFTISAALMTFPYFILQTEVLYSAVFWQFCFAAINIFHVILLLRARRPVELSAEQQLVKDMVFRPMTSRETKRLLELAEWHTAQPSQQLINCGQDTHSLYLLKSGTVDIIQKNRVITHRGPGSFLGELNYMTGSLPIADVKFSSTGEYLSWRKDTLEKFLNQNGDIRTAFRAVISTNIAGKLSRNEAGTISTS